MANRAACIKFYSLIVCCIVICWPGLYALADKKAYLDSLNNQLKQAAEDTNKVKLLFTIAKNYPDYDPNKGLATGQQALTLAEHLEYHNGIAAAYLAIGLNECSLPDYTKAKQHFNQALEIAAQTGNKKIAGLANKDLGIAYIGETNYPQALKYFFDALQIEQELHNRQEIFAVLEYIGIVYEGQKDFTKALKYYKMSFDSAQATGDKKANGKNLLNIGQVNQQLGRNKEAFGCYTEALKTFREQHDEGGIAAALADIGAVSLQLHDYATALKNNFEGLAIYERFSDRQNIAGVTDNIGKIYLAAATDTLGSNIPDSLTNKNASLQKAFYFLNKAKAMCKSLSYLDGMYTVSYDLSVAHEAAGNYGEALKNYKEYIALRDSIYSGENNAKISNLEIARELAIKDQQLKIKQLELRQKRNENAYFIIGIGLLLGIIFTLYRNFSTQKKLNATIGNLAAEQEKIIASRTEALQQSNKKLVDLVQFNVHNLREPITRITGLLLLKKEIGDEDFFINCLPMIDEAVTDLDNTLKDLIKTTEETGKA